MLHFIVGIIFKNTQNWHVLHIASCNLNMIFFVCQSFWLFWHLISIEFIEGTLILLFVINNSCILLTAFDVLSKFWKFPTWLSSKWICCLFQYCWSFQPYVFYEWLWKKPLIKQQHLPSYLLTLILFLTTNLWMLEVLVLFFFGIFKNVSMFESKSSLSKIAKYCTCNCQFNLDV